MILRKLLGFGTAVTLAMTPFTLQADGVLNVYNWAEYIGEDTIAEFEAETGIKVRYDFFDSLETLETKMLTGGSGYDIIFPSASIGERLIATGSVLELDRSQLANYDNLDSKITSIIAKQDAGNSFLLPYTWGTTGIGYNAAMIEERMADAPVNSLDMLFKPEIAAKFADCGIAMMGTQQDVFGMALNYLGLDPYTEDANDIEAAQNLLSAVRPYVRYFDSLRQIDDLANGEICLGMGYSGDISMAAFTALDNGSNRDIRYTIPTEGAQIWFDVIAIPFDAPNVENAHIFLDYMLRGEVMADASNYLFYANGNAASLEYVVEDVKSDPNIYPPEDVMERLYSDLSLTQKAIKLRTRAWTRVKTGN